MARKRSTENEIVLSAGAAAPVRRKTASTTPRTRRAAAAKKSDVETPGTAIPSAAPTHEEIAARAYLYWEARGCQGGCPEEDWSRAERELLARRAAAAIA